MTQIRAARPTAAALHEENGWRSCHSTTVLRLPIEVASSTMAAVAEAVEPSGSTRRSAWGGDCRRVVCQRWAGQQAVCGEEEVLCGSHCAA